MTPGTAWGETAVVDGETMLKGFLAQLCVITKVNVVKMLVKIDFVGTRDIDGIYIVRQWYNISSTKGSDFCTMDKKFISEVMALQVSCLCELS